MLTERAILEHFSGWDLTDKERAYLNFHAPRFAYVLKTVAKCLPRTVQEANSDVSLLDIGPSTLTELLAVSFPDVTINTLGFRHPQCYREERVHSHWQYDLNEAQYPERWPSFAPHDVVVMAEVIEHLYTAPELVLGFVDRLLKPGGFLIVQTPNAVALNKRWTMLRGANPYSMIRKSRENPGHFREYTLPELRHLAKEVGWTVAGWDLGDYFNAPLPLSARLLGMLRSNFRQGITIVYRKPGAAQQNAA